MKNIITLGMLIPPFLYGGLTPPTPALSHPSYEYKGQPFSGDKGPVHYLCAVHDYLTADVHVNTACSIGATVSCDLSWKYENLFHIRALLGIIPVEVFPSTTSSYKRWWIPSSTLQGSLSDESTTALAYGLTMLHTAGVKEPTTFFAAYITVVYTYFLNHAESTTPLSFARVALQALRKSVWGTTPHYEKYIDMFKAYLIHGMYHSHQQELDTNGNRAWTHPLEGVLFTSELTKRLSTLPVIPSSYKASLENIMNAWDAQADPNSALTK